MSGFEFWLVGLAMGAVPSFIIGISAGKMLERDNNREIVAEAIGTRKGIELILNNSKTRREI